MGELSGMTAVVTGAGRMRSIGHSAAVALAREGANVVVTGTGRSPDRYPDDEKAAGWRDVESVADEVREAGAKALPMVVDVRDSQAIKDCLAQTVKEFGSVDILVNNAAAAKGNDRVPFIELDDELWRLIIDVNLTGSYYASKYAALQMIEQGKGGRIINISSVAGLRASANTGAYGVSKAGMIGMNRYFAVELARYDINVNCVAPGLTATYRIDDIMKAAEENPTMLRSVVPMGRAGSPDEVADAIVFFAGPRSSYITGQTLNVDGGIYMD
ncbi:MAG: SDR family NAD(P)-dependent oxidoreductase [Dehalococcoidia bacterium]